MNKTCAPKNTHTLAVVFPAVAARWNFERNGDVTPDMVAPKSGKKYWWWCTKFPHTWFASVANRTNGSGCSICNGKTVLAGHNDLLFLRADIAAEWDHKRNGDLKPDMVTPGSSKKAYWLCKAYGHSWQAKVQNRTAGKGCTKCSSHEVEKDFNDFAHKFPDEATEWDHDRNDGLTPQMVTYGSGTPRNWLCKAHGHQWSASPHQRGRGASCPTCASIVITDPDMTAAWHHEGNGDLTPEMVTAGSRKVVSWWCNDHPHTYMTAVQERKRGRGCAVCAGRQLDPSFNSITARFPRVAAEWHPVLNGSWLPTEVTSGSGKSAWWLCSAHGHEWSAQICNRTAGFGCPYCAGQKVLANFNDIAYLYPHIAAEWDIERNGGLLPSEVLSRSPKPRFWRCLPEGHQWRATPNDRTGSRKTGCPDCSRTGTSLTEAAFFRVVSQFLVDGVQGAKVPLVWSKQAKTAALDVSGLFNGFRVAVEFDGVFYHDRPAAVVRDIDKTAELLAAGYTVVRVREGNLPYLELTDPRLLQLSYEHQAGSADEMDAAVQPTADAIRVWLEQVCPDTATAAA